MKTERIVKHAERPAGRWALLTSDGRHIWFDRVGDEDAEGFLATKPGLAENIRRALHKQGLAGWLVAIEGDYWGADALRFSGWHRLTAMSASMAAALALFGKARCERKGQPRVKAR